MENKLDEKSKVLLTRSSDRISLLYVEKARIEQSDYGVQIRQGNRVSEIPITALTCLILGPGCSITHRAVENIAKASCSICWMGSDQAVFYAYGEPATHKSKNILKQMRYHESKMLHTQVVRQMYQWRYPDEKVKSKSIAELRGAEGLKMRACYQKYAKEYRVDWDKRDYNFMETDPVNQYLTALNQFMYAITQACIIIMGYSPAIGFIHTGHMQSFVFDIADLFKEEIIIPLAFKLTSRYGIFNRNNAIREFRQELTEKRVLARMAEYITGLFSDDTETTDIKLDLFDTTKFENKF